MICQQNMWKYGVTAPLLVSLAKTLLQNWSNSTVSMAFAMDTMELLQFCTKI